MAKLYFYYSAMNAGKSTILLQSSYNYNERGMDTLLFIPGFSAREKDKVSSRIGLHANAIPINDKFNFHTYIQQALSDNPKIKCILVDEAQFLTKEQVIQLSDVTDWLGVPVLAYGLRSDFKAEPFPGSMYLLALADELNEIKTICHCGSKAIMNMRLDEDGNAVDEGEQVAIGGNDRYIATCRKHFKLKETGKTFVEVTA